MAAVFENLVDVQIERLREPVPYLVQLCFDILVPFGLFSLLYELVYPVCIDGDRCRFGKAVRDVDELAYRYLAVQYEPGDACESTQEDFGDDDDIDDLADQGTLDAVVTELMRMVGVVRVVKEYVAVEVLDPEGKLPVHDDGDGDDDGLVDNVNDEVGCELREELAESEVVVDGYRER